MQQRRIPDEFRNPRRRAQIFREPDVHLLGAGRGLVHVDGVQRVERESERYVFHGCYLPLGNACRCANGVLKVVQMRRPGSLCCGSPSKSDTENSVIQLVDFRGWDESFWRGDTQRANIPSTPTKNAFSRAVYRTTRHTVGPSAIRSTQVLAPKPIRIFHIDAVPVDLSPAPITYGLVGCVHGWLNGGRGDGSTLVTQQFGREQKRYF